LQSIAPKGSREPALSDHFTPKMIRNLFLLKDVLNSIPLISYIQMGIFGKYYITL